MLQTTITTSRGIPYTLSLARDVDNHKYIVEFWCQRKDSTPQSETHPFTDFSKAYNCYKRNVHYYNDVVLGPLDEEAFLGLPSGFLFGNRVHVTKEVRYV